MVCSKLTRLLFLEEKHVLLPKTPRNSLDIVVRAESSLDLVNLACFCVTVLNIHSISEALWGFVRLRSKAIFGKLKDWEIFQKDNLLLLIFADCLECFLGEKESFERLAKLFYKVNVF